MLFEFVLTTRLCDLLSHAFIASATIKPPITVAKMFLTTPFWDIVIHTDFTPVDFLAIYAGSVTSLCVYLLLLSRRSKKSKPS